MAKLNGFDGIKTIFDDLKKVYYCPTTINNMDMLEDSLELQQLPITEDGVTLNFGNANTTFKKLNTGEIWGSTVDRDDPEVSFNVATVSETINKWFMGEVEANSNAQVDFGEDEKFNARGYKSTLNPKTGSLWFPAENGEGWVVLPNIKMYGGLNGTDDSNTAYYAVSVTPSENAAGATIYFLTKGGSGASKTKLVYLTVSGSVVKTLYVVDKADAEKQISDAGYQGTVPASITDGLTIAVTAKS